MTLKRLEVSESNQILIDSVLKKRTKDFITRLSLKNKYDKDNLQYKSILFIIPFFWKLIIVKGSKLDIDRIGDTVEVRYEIPLIRH
jgi:hypothetical protein